MRRKSKVTLGVAAFAVLALTACGGPAGTTSSDPAEEPEESGASSTEHPYGLEVVESPEFEEGTTMAELAEAGSITIGTKFDQPLFGLVGPDGAPVGFDVAIGSLIAAELGIPFESIEWTETVSANREPFIEQGQVDIVVATYTINDARKEKVDFAGPYYLAGQALMVQLAKDGMTMIVVTHEMGFARKAADRVLFMADGRIVEEASPAEFFDHPKSDRAKDFLSKILEH